MRSFFRERFKAKYFWSAFLVLGVLSISIGSNRLDPLIVKALALQDRTSKLMDYAFTEGTNVTVVGDAGVRTFVLADGESAAQDPIKIFPIDGFKALAEAINAANQIGDDTLTGGKNDDTFVFEAGDGNDRIKDFGTGADVIDFAGQFASFDDVKAAASQGSKGVTIAYDGGSVLLEGWKLADLAEGHFALDA